MLTRITKFQRLDYMQQGFTHLGYSSGVAEMLHTKSHEQLCRELDKLITEYEDCNVVPRTIVKYTSRKITDSNGGSYYRRGKTYLYKNLLIHLNNKFLTASIMLVNI